MLCSSACRHLSLVVGAFWGRREAAALVAIT
jgi:hypothetical protein